MKLKEIKPGMAIHCKTQEEYKRLDEEVRNLGFGRLPIRFDNIPFSSNYVYVITEDDVFWNDVTHREYTEFSDLIIPELTAEEVLQTCVEICNGIGCGECPMYTGNCFMNLDSDKQKVVEICQQWKSDHEKKELEIETVDICRIIEIQPDGHKKCVHEEDIKSDLPFSGNERAEVEEILKNYCMEHKGEFIAVHEVVSRVKAVK